VLLIRSLILMYTGIAATPRRHGFGVWLQTLVPDQPQVKFGECSSHPEVELDSQTSPHDEPVEGLSGGDVSTQAPNQPQVKLYVHCSLVKRIRHSPLDRLSDEATMTSGVVQGSGIGPVSSHIFVDELAKLLERHGVVVKLFADDVKVYLEICNVDDAAKLQKALDLIAEWAIALTSYPADNY